MATSKALKSCSKIPVAAEMRNIYPGVHFHFYSRDAVEVSERLDHGSLDFAVMLAPVLDPDVCFLSLEPKLPTKVALVWKKRTSIGKTAGTFKSMLEENLKL